MILPSILIGRRRRSIPLLELVMDRGHYMYTPTAGEIQVDVLCGVCGEVCSVTRDVTGPTSMTEAMSGGSHKHDVFCCSNASEEWHIQIVDLMKFQKSIPSKKLSDLVEEEIKEVLASKRVTKSGYRLF